MNFIMSNIPVTIYSLPTKEKNDLVSFFSSLIVIRCFIVHASCVLGQHLSLCLNRILLLPVIKKRTWLRFSWSLVNAGYNIFLRGCDGIKLLLKLLLLVLIFLKLYFFVHSLYHADAHVQV